MIVKVLGPLLGHSSCVQSGKLTSHHINLQVYKFISQHLIIVHPNRHCFPHNIHAMPSKTTNHKIIAEDKTSKVSLPFNST